jgi:cobalt/nickel transport system permease protein
VSGVRPLWQLIGVASLATVAVLGVVGLITGGGDPGHVFGADWTTVDWPSVAAMLLVTAIMAVVIVPLVYLVLPRGVKRVGAAFTAVAVIAPLGLIAPGFAYGEGTPGDVGASFGYVPSGLNALSSFFSAPLAGYTIPLPFFSDANGAMWQAGIGYEIAGMAGILLIGAAMLGLAWLLRRRGSEQSDDATQSARA